LNIYLSAPGSFGIAANCVYLSSKPGLFGKQVKQDDRTNEDHNR
jgi:hypothetical protein